MLKYLPLLLCSLMSFVIDDNPVDIAANAYVEKYKELAVIEMHRSGIPASITLAQALHESGIGESDLAIYANNHFGIKCKSYWQGQTYRHKDDDYDADGNLIKSCFRSYESVLDSYVDHSNFLTQSPHYAELFNYDKTDYKRWAYGLKKCGYATDPQYAIKLIDKIERYNLHMYDTYRNPMVAE